MEAAAGTPPLPASVAERSAAPSLPLPVLLAVAGTLSIAIGGPWDVSWHMTIGRDTFWTPAHLAIYLGGSLTGFVCGWLAIRATFLAPAERAGAVRILGGYAPFGAWIGIWGAAAMLTSAPFDNWWHNAYGLDVKVLSPPHVLLFVGILVSRLGVWLLVLREQNRSIESRAAAVLFACLGGLCIGSLSGLFLVEFWPNRQHGAQFFFLSSLVFPFLLCAVSRASRLRWGATLAALTYMLFHCLLTWILPLFPAEPKLGPVYNHVTHMVPPYFPEWIIVPAFFIDLLRPVLTPGRGWRRDLLFGASVAGLFLLVFYPVQWKFAEFLISPASDNWFFGGTRIWPYSHAINPFDFEFRQEAGGWSLPSVARTLAGAFASSFLGVRFGNWMTRVQR